MMPFAEVRQNLISAGRGHEVDAAIDAAVDMLADAGYTPGSHDEFLTTIDHAQTLLEELILRCPKLFADKMPEVVCQRHLCQGDEALATYAFTPDPDTNGVEHMNEIKYCATCVADCIYKGSFSSGEVASLHRL